MGIFRHLSKSLKSTLIRNPRYPFMSVRSHFSSAYGSPKWEWPAIFELKVKSGLIVFLTMSATGHSKGGIQTAPLNPVGGGEDRCLSSPASLHLCHCLLQSKVSTNNVQMHNFQGLHPKWGQTQGSPTLAKTKWTHGDTVKGTLTSRHHNQASLCFLCEL